MPPLLAPPIHVRPAPSADPPYDDETTGALGGVPPPPSPLEQPPLPLDWSGPPRPFARSPAAGPGRHEADQPPATGRPRSPAHGATRHFLSLCLEVLNGYRPVAHLRPLIAPARFDTVAEQITRAAARAGAPQRRPLPTAQASRFAPVRRLPARPVGRPAAHGPAARIRLCRLLVCEPRPGVIEAAAVLGQNGRAFALALRLERRPSGWLCVLAQLV